MKKGPLSNNEKQFIDDNLNVDIESLAGKLERSISIIENYVNIKKTEHVNPIENKLTDMDLYARNKDRGVVVMTENASIMSDEKRKKPNINETRKYRNIIHKIKED